MHKRIERYGGGVSRSQAIKIAKSIPEPPGIFIRDDGVKSFFFGTTFTVGRIYGRFTPQTQWSIQFEPPDPTGAATATTSVVLYQPSTSPTEMDRFDVSVDLTGVSSLVLNLAALVAYDPISGTKDHVRLLLFP